MKKVFSRLSIGLSLFLAFSLIQIAPAMATPASIVGKITDELQIAGDDGFVYEIADTKMGNNVVKHVGAVVAVIGIVTEEEDIRTITVTSFRILSEPNKEFEPLEEEEKESQLEEGEKEPQ